MADEYNPLIHYEHGIPVVDTKLSEIQREQKEAKNREKEQLKLNRRMVNFTLLLVVVGAVGSGLSIWQARISSRSAAAATSAAQTAHDTLTEVQRSGTDTHDLAVQAENQSKNTEKLAKKF